MTTRLGTFTAFTIAGLVTLNLAACTANMRADLETGVETSGYVGYTPKADPETSWRDKLDWVEGRYGVEINVKVTQPGDARNCGAMLSPDNIGGCFNPAEANKIYISDGMDKALTEFVILHEAAHLVQNSRGWALDECRADDLAVAWGADAPSNLRDCQAPEATISSDPTDDDGVHLDNEDESTYEELSDSDLDELELDGEENRNK